MRVKSYGSGGRRNAIKKTKGIRKPTKPRRGSKVKGARGGSKGSRRTKYKNKTVGSKSVSSNLLKALRGRFK